MRLLLLTPGTGNFHCGSCLRDHTLVRALRRLGHEATSAPMYLPQVFDDATHETEVLNGSGELFFGGINVYLQQKAALFRHTPRWLDRWLDRPSLLRRAADHAGMTRAADLGALTVSMLRGRSSAQRKELARLLDWLRRQPRPDAVLLNNALLAGLAEPIARTLDVPVVCTLHGESGFLDSLIEPWRARAWDALRDTSDAVTAWIAVSEHYGRRMADRLRLAPERWHVVHNGIDLEGFVPSATRPDPPTLGFLARLCPAKNPALLVEAFIRLRRRDSASGARLCLAGAVTPSDRAYVESLRRPLADAGMIDAVDWRANLTRAEKCALVPGFSVLCVPATADESFGLYVLEAWACGVPVVQPRHGAFPEIIEGSGGGMLVEPDDPDALADALAELLADESRRGEMGRAGHRAVMERFTDRHMASGVIEVVERLTRPAAAGVESGA